LVIFSLDKAKNLFYLIFMKINGVDYYTVKEMEEKTGKDTNAIKQWLFKHNIKPVVKDAIYESNVLKELLKASSPGRPPKKMVKKKP